MHFIYVSQIERVSLILPEVLSWFFSMIPFTSNQSSSVYCYIKPFFTGFKYYQIRVIWSVAFPFILILLFLFVFIGFRLYQCMRKKSSNENSSNALVIITPIVLVLLFSQQGIISLVMSENNYLLTQYQKHFSISFCYTSSAHLKVLLDQTM